MYNSVHNHPQRKSFVIQSSLISHRQFLKHTWNVYKEHFYATFLPIAPFCFFGGGGSKMRCCCWGGSVEYNGMILMSPTSGPKSSTSRFILLQASSISYKIKVWVWKLNEYTLNILSIYHIPSFMGHIFNLVIKTDLTNFIGISNIIQETLL